MPTVLYVLGWRLFFFMNERNEPIHIHCEKAEKSCKYWLDVENFDIIEAYRYNLTGSDTRLVRKIIFQNFDLIVQEWERIQHEKNS
jgi:hypothetical protein